ncbi:NrdG Organic radical activating enzymes [uncultured Caudovirales phage]|uniref:NrdG Organic radical activating enzymes n=1 Tax=uncultured Caudovirales phage TaxID=2100421 RepID=A0A6J5P0B6_9CAUD|nr:NrdG Organic radical activating enzymes [uncultured Caudovirales phage]
MFGMNEAEKFLAEHDGREIDYVELFLTIQGEGPHAGRPAVFLRTAGCHLRCTFCDTDFVTGRMRDSVSAIVERIHRIRGKSTLVVITGGEPMRQNIGPLINCLIEDLDMDVQIETAGTFAPHELFRDIWDGYLMFGKLQIVVSPKTAAVNSWFHNRAAAWKYIVPPEGVDERGIPRINTQRRDGSAMTLPLPDVPASAVYLQPMDCYDKDKNAEALSSATTAAIRHGFKLCLQLHKIAGVP